MILSDRTLRTLIRKKQMALSPLTEEQIQPASIDLRLGTHFLTLRNSSENDVITIDSATTYESIVSEET
ncbi:2'-deoxycytidine 5'-triphosphate deaminase [Paenibacillus peoriae]|uniref:2'-deoxycytidine 5'-triphosphate deaminase domain-containing protein n=1 Tax=Paenibacillus peoriae TaxID=59893 RepID=UPI0030CE6B76